MRYLFIILIVTAAGCYTLPKAKTQHGKAVSTFPVIGADFCARVYPCLPSEIRSDTVTVFDTLWGEPTIEVLTDTLKFNDTLRIVKTVQLPSKTITRTVTIRDSIRVIDKAALDKCEIERKQETTRANSEQQLKEKFRGQRNKAYFIIAGLGLLIGLWAFFRFRKRTKK